MRSFHRILGLAVAALGAVAGTLTTGCGSDCTKTLTCGENAPPGSGGAGGVDNSGGATTTTTTSSAGGATTTTGTGGGPLLSLGDPCAAGTDCDSGLCTDGVCCDAACDGTCEACDIAGSEGTCTAHASGTDPEVECGQATCDGMSACNNGQPIWSQAFGSAGNDEGWAITSDGNNNLYVAGGFSGTITIGSMSLTSAGNTDIFVAKLSAAGNLIWAKRFGDAELQHATHILVQGPSVFVAGRYRGKPVIASSPLPESIGTGVWVGRVDPATGNATMAVGYEASSTLTSLSVGGFTYAQNSLFLGTESFTNVFPSTVSNSRVRKLNPTTGAELAAVDWGDDASILAMVTAANDDLLVVGSFDAAKSFGGSTLTPQGSDGFVIRMTSGLAHIWSTKAGGSGNDSLQEVVERSNGDIVAVGSSDTAFAFGGDQVANSGGRDAILLTLSSGGIAQSGSSMGGSGNESVISAALDSQDNVVLGATFDAPLTIDGTPHANNGGKDVLLVKLDPTLAPVWSFATGGLSDQSPKAITVDTLDRIAVIGSFAESIQLDALHASAGGTDVFLGQISP